MAMASLERHGMRLDELNRIRVVDEETDSHANELKEHCDEFVSHISEFQKISDSFISIFDHVSTAVERQVNHDIDGSSLKCLILNGFLPWADYKVVCRRPWNHFLPTHPPTTQTLLK
jgi:hypothetical protein